MELRYLVEFSMIARYENFSLAAEELFISQSSLSKHIKTLETELGVPLFERTTRTVHLSEYGRLLLPFAQEVSGRLDDFTAQLQKKQESRRSALKVASIPVMAQYGITEALYAFRTAHPEIQLSVAEREACQLRDMLARGECDLAFQRFAAEKESPYPEISYCTDTMVAVLPEDHRLAGAPTIALSDLKNDVFLLLDENTMMYRICLDACASAGFTPQMAYKGHRPENIIGLVARGMGVSLLMRRQADFYKNPGIVCPELSERIVSRVSLIREPGRPITPPIQTFISFLENYIAPASAAT
ncbi:MAG: LysR family transcriptional regulator [Clostridiales bacterium]|nr:LysR family transcriptional regulator [Clostridiales bacterium]